MFSSFLFSQDKKVKLFYLGGQSNMDGFGYIKDLPDSLNKEIKDVYIFHGNLAPDDDSLNGGLGKWTKLKAGHGTGFSSDGIRDKLSDRFGVELSFAKRLKEYYPDEKIAIIKYSKGGTSIDGSAAGDAGSWDVDYVGNNGINQYDHFLKTLNIALSNSDIDNDGKKDILIPTGIIWMQGEADASYSEKIAKKYYHNLKRLMNLLRAALRVDDIPVVIGKISDSNKTRDGLVWKYGDLVMYAQEKYAREDINAGIVRATKNYNYSDPWHYDSYGYIDLGNKFADMAYKLANIEVINFIFATEKGERFYFTMHKNTNKATLKFQKRSYLLKRKLSASGEKYANKNERVIFWNKGNKAMIMIDSKEYLAVKN